MRTIDTDENWLFTAPGGRSTFLRVDVKDGGGTWQDLTTYAGGRNLILSAVWRDGVDNNGQNATITFKREEEQASIAPLMQGSPLNRAYAYPGSYSPILAVKRAVRIYSADMPGDAPPSSGAWRKMFEGKIDSIDSASDENVTIECSDAQGDLRDAFIEAERVYSFCQGTHATKGARVWTSLTTTVAGELVVPTDANRNGHFYIAQTTGTSGVTEPVWPTGGSATVVDNSQTWKESGATDNTVGTAVETVMNQIIADNGGTDTVAVPGGSPGWDIKWFLQQRQSVWDALRALTDQIGWDLRYRFDSGSGNFLLSLEEPDRSVSVPDRTFGAAEQWMVQGLKIDVAKIRNAVQVVFSASGSMDPSGNPLRVPLIIEDSASIATYGRRFMEMGEGSTSNIDTSAEATVMATAAVADLKDPQAERSVVLPYFPFVELGDFYRFSADYVYADADMDLAVVSYEHSINAEGIAQTTLTCRGKPCSGTARWLGRSSELNTDDIHKLTSAVLDESSLFASSVVGGTLLQAQGLLNKQSTGQDYEWHVSTTYNFTPDSTTIVQSQGGDQVTVPDLIPGKTYHAKTVPTSRNASRIVRGQPSADLEFVAGRASAGHIVQGIALGSYPLNGGFETHLDGSDMPDHWTIQVGTLGVNIAVKTDANGVSGTRYLRLDSSAGVPATVHTAQIPIINEASVANRYSGLYRLTLWVKNALSNNGSSLLEIDAYSYDYSGANIGSFGTIASLASNSKMGFWQRIEGLLVLDSITGTRSIDLFVHTAYGTGQCIIDVDEYRIEYLGTPWYKVGDTSKYIDAYEAIPDFANGWSDASTADPDCTRQPPAMRRDQFGDIELQGRATGGSVGDVPIWTLPASMRPATTLTFVVPTDQGPGELEVQSCGDICLRAGGNGYVDLSGIRFRLF